MSVVTVAAPRGIEQLSSSLVTAARQYGTPAYVMDMVAVALAAGQVEAAFGRPWILQYSLKANDLPAIAAFLAGRGWGGNVVSGGEWLHARNGGLGNSAISFEGIGKTDAELRHAVAETAAGRPPRWLAIESPEEAELLAALATRAQLGRDGIAPLDVLLRLNPEVAPETRDEFAVGRAASKFGMTAAEIHRLVRGVLSGAAPSGSAGGPDGTGRASRPGLRVRGIHVHVGSGLNDVRAWSDAGVRATRLLGELAPDLELPDTVDYGGGFPLRAGSAPAPAQFRAALDSALSAAGLRLPPRPVIEPGRYLVGRAGWLISSVLHARPGRPANAQRQLVMDAGMTEFMRPALYGSHHRAHPVPAGCWPGDSFAQVAVEGPVCESTDSFGTHDLPPLRRGDLVAFEDAGAYAASFTSRYNGRPHPPEALLWPDGSLQLCERADVTATEPSAWQPPAAEPHPVPHSSASGHKGVGQ
jgi:diaminopimelate decarboxylase